MSALFDLKGRVALVTGGSRGIGRMIAEAYVRAGVRTYITARKAAALEAAAAEMCEFGECIAMNSDLSDLDGIKTLTDTLAARESQLDILVNNAGAAWGAPYDEFPEEGWDKVMDLNVKSLFFLTQQLTPLLRSSASAEQPAKVINIASIDGIYVTENETYSYVASKAAVIHLTRRLAMRLTPEHIHVNAIAPGAFQSDMNIWARDNPEKVAKMVPAGRIGNPEDMGGTAIYMASRAGDYLVGVTLTVDGGVAYAR